MRALRLSPLTGSGGVLNKVGTATAGSVDYAGRREERSRLEMSALMSALRNLVLFCYMLHVTGAAHSPPESRPFSGAPHKSARPVRFMKRIITKMNT